MPAVPPTYLDRIGNLLATRRRILLGLVGAPGSGKSTLAQALHETFADVSVIVPMDGFHLAGAELRRLGLAGKKGAPETFDSAGYVALLRRIRAQRTGETVYAPRFHREIEEPVAGAIAVQPSTPLVITEGNYLLLESGHWADVAGLLDETWYVDIDSPLRVERLVGRHVHFGRSPQAAEEWVRVNDEANARLIETTRARATVLFRW
ncbi:MAG TPA: nucleoside/nucleotide kinase family protein [Burkholderiaceae bacterium]|nr:nucleoside/nucleotide kinase family protein [Burkholderiaceae bacterium]